MTNLVRTLLLIILAIAPVENVFVHADAKPSSRPVQGPSLFDFAKKRRENVIVGPHEPR